MPVRTASTQFVGVQEAHISARLLWPFFRTIGSGPIGSTAHIFARAGLDTNALARPDTRIPHRLAMEALVAWLTETGDAALGVRAGTEAESSDFEPLERLARTCSTFREALVRYFRVWHEASEATVVEQGARALWRFRVTDDVPQPRVANDFIVVCAARFALRCLRAMPLLHEVHFMHPRPTNVGPYDMFRAEARFGCLYNGFLFDADLLAQPLPGANPRMRAILEAYVRDYARTAGPCSVRRVPD